jgi:hypothetical protein
MKYFLDLFHQLVKSNRLELTGWKTRCSHGSTTFMPLYHKGQYGVGFHSGDGKPCCLAQLGNLASMREADVQIKFVIQMWIDESIRRSK